MKSTMCRSDAMCGAKHPVADAVHALIAEGGKVDTLKADAPANAELDKLAGKMAELSGDVNGMTVMVKSVKMGMIKK